MSGYISSATRDLLSAELDQLRKDLDTQDSDLQLAADAGDNSQNGDIFTVFEEQAKLNARVAVVEKVLSESSETQPPTGDVVEAGVVVEIEFGPGDTETFIFGSVEELARKEFDVISPDSPIGSAVEGKSVGDTATVQTGASFDITVKSIEVLL